MVETNLSPATIFGIAPTSVFSSNGVTELSIVSPVEDATNPGLYPTGNVP